jgi:hypothetical protein
MEDVGIFHVFGIVVAIWYILWSFGIFLPFCYFVPRKIWQPFSAAEFEARMAHLQTAVNYKRLKWRNFDGHSFGAIFGKTYLHACMQGPML